MLTSLAIPGINISFLNLDQHLHGSIVLAEPSVIYLQENAKRIISPKIE
jgi:hypothetical protein